MVKKKKQVKTFTGSEWTFKSIDEGWNIINNLAKKYNWEGYPVQFEVVSSEQMLDAYSSHGMPEMYAHWSFGKDFYYNQHDYEHGHSSLAYELIINTNPTICYIMEDNTQMMQLLVTAHAAVGHNHFFKHNYLFKEWTEPEYIISYLKYAKKFIANCEVNYGEQRVELLLDAAHALEMHSIDKYKRRTASSKELKDKEDKRDQNIFETYSKEIHGDFKSHKDTQTTTKSGILKEENLLLFIANNSPVLEDWEKEILKIKCNISQYFYPAMQTKMLNEGFASFVHHTLMTDLYDAGHIDDDYMFEFFHSHSSVLYQPNFNKDYMSQTLFYINPYSLGFNLFQEIKRICEKPTEEDLEFCPQFCNTNWVETVNYVVENYKDETAILEFLTPNLIRKLKLFNLETTAWSNEYTIAATHTNKDHDEIRKKLSRQFNLFSMVPDVECWATGNIKKELLTLNLEIRTFLNNSLDKEYLDAIVQYLQFLWGPQIEITHRSSNGNVLWSDSYDSKYTIKPRVTVTQPQATLSPNSVVITNAAQLHTYFLGWNVFVNPKLKLCIQIPGGIPYDLEHGTSKCRGAHIAHGKFGVPECETVHGDCFVSLLQTYNPNPMAIGTQQVGGVTLSNGRWIQVIP